MTGAIVTPECCTSSLRSLVGDGCPCSCLATRYFLDFRLTGLGNEEIVVIPEVVFGDPVRW